MQKKLFYILILVPNILFAQYYGERTTEQSFEESKIYFNSNFLNTFGIYNFKDVAAGLIDDYFLNLKVNPANLPVMGNDKDIYLYLDFRGDRTETPIVKTYIMPAYYYEEPVYNPYVNCIFWCNHSPFDWYNKRFFYRWYIPIDLQGRKVLYSSLLDL